MPLYLAFFNCLKSTSQVSAMLHLSGTVFVKFMVSTGFFYQNKNHTYFAVCRVFIFNLVRNLSRHDYNMEQTRKRTHKRTERNFLENALFGIETHYITTKKNTLCNNSLKQTYEHVPDPPFNFVILYQAPVTVIAKLSVSAINKFE